MRAVIYARYSSDNQTEASIEGQLRECMEFAERAGIDVIGNYIDRAFSAKSDHRPEFQRMIKDSYKHAFDCIIVWKLDRFSRNRYDSAHYKALLRKNGVKVISAKETIAEGSEGILLESPRRYGGILLRRACREGNARNEGERPKRLVEWRQRSVRLCDKQRAQARYRPASRARRSGDIQVEQRRKDGKGNL